MSTSNIPEAAVQAAALVALELATPDFPWTDLVPEAQAQYLTAARITLEAAAPHIIRAAKAEAWDECEGAKYLVMVKADGHGLVRVKDNPYAISTPYRPTP